MDPVATDQLKYVNKPKGGNVLGYKHSDRKGPLLFSMTPITLLLAEEKDRYTGLMQRKYYAFI